MNKSNKSLDVIQDCNGCGVCCLHMGYPAFMVPRDPATAQQIENDAEFRALLDAGWTQQELLHGHPGEMHWHKLPDDLKLQWQNYVAEYDRDGDMDGPCFWFDIETRLCKHHQFRPQVCRDFEAGSDECGQWRREYRHLLKHAATS